MRRRVLTGLLVLMIAGAFHASTALSLGAEKANVAPPNILLFLVDDMGWQDTSEPFWLDAEGNEKVTPLNKRYRTPNMESLADRGRKFINAYSHSVCTPTRTSIMTGMNSARHRVTTWTAPLKPGNTGDYSYGKQNVPLKSPDWRMTGFRKDWVSLPALLKTAGYRTIHCGKAHFGPDSEFGGKPENIGFDVNIAGSGIGQPGSYYGQQDFGKGKTHYVHGLETYHGQEIFLTEALTREMCGAIEAAVSTGVPFFAYMANYALHAPFQTDPRFAANYPDLKGGALAYATLIEGMDKSLGDLLDKLQELGVADNTLVIFLSDNGGDAPIENPCAPLRFKKGSCYEGGMRVPMIVAWGADNPDNPYQKQLPIPKNSVEDDIVACFDLYPTLAAVAGAKVDHPVDGYDIRPYMAGKSGTHRPQEWLQHFPHIHRSIHFTAYRMGDWKAIYHYIDKRWELFNLADDIGEKNDLASTNPEKLRVMAQRMKEVLDAMDAQYSLNRKEGTPVGLQMPK